MGRPAKASSANSKHMTNAQREIRETTEKLLAGSGEVEAPSYLTASQTEIFNFIKSNFDESKMLGSVDAFVLAEAAVTIDQLQTLDREANENPQKLYDGNYIRAKANCTKDFFRLCNELCLSPQSRAKIAISAVKSQEQKKQTLMDMLNAEDED